jgi:hypothetical protein
MFAVIVAFLSALVVAPPADIAGGNTIIQDINPVVPPANDQPQALLNIQGPPADKCIAEGNI